MGDSMVGEKHNKWTVLSFDGRNKNNNSMWLCRCDCGTEKVVMGSHLRNGQSKQCKTCSTRINGRKGLNAMHGPDLYFVELDGFIKIGSTDNVGRRFRNIQACCPHKLNLLYHGPGEGELEAVYHEIFADLKHHGEWFNFN